MNGSIAVNGFGGFLDYVRRHLAGELAQDQAYKWYDLLYGATNRRLMRALMDCNFWDGSLQRSLALCLTRVRERGYAEVNDALLRQLLLEWNVWRRLEGGELKKWPHRK